MSEDEERVLTVFELAQGLKITVETATAGCFLEGEVGRVQRPTSGHIYFVMKDDHRDAMIDCVMYKREAMRFGSKVVEGQRAQLRGRATFYPPRGRLQWVADLARPAGQGALLQALEQLKQKLIAEGLTDPARKRPLPSFPHLVGVVTSRTGAALADIRSVAARRGKVRILVAPAVVQGETAVQSLLNALDRIERARPDVVIVGRGGGAAEDLAAFNDERVVRRVARMAMPVVSAVGHEVDIALTDLVADARAATPSQAAELVVPDAAMLMQLVTRGRLQLVRAQRSRLVQLRLELKERRSKIGDPRFLLFEHQQALDERRFELKRLIGQKAVDCSRRLERHQRRLFSRHPRLVIGRSRAQLVPLQQKMISVMRAHLFQKKSELGQAGASLHALSPLSVLGRGFALASAPGQRVLRDTKTLSVGDEVTVVLQKGAFIAKVQKVVFGVDNPPALHHESTDSGKSR